VINVSQFRQLIVDPALQVIEHYSPAASDLVMGTAAVESRFEHIKQLGTGPALGFFQMEPATHNDIWNNYLAYRRELRDQIVNACESIVEPMPAERMMYDLRYASMMCRVHYLRVKEALPSSNSPEDLGAYWKRHYNTELGAGTVDKFVEAYALTQ